jgi:hypothetical protein
MRSIILESLEDFQEYGEAYEVLRQECGAPIFSSYDLVQLWLDNFKAEVKPYIVLIEDGGKLIGAAPMFTIHSRVMGLPIDMISIVGDLDPPFGYSHYSVFAKQDNPEAIREMVSCVKRAKWNKLVMTHMEPNISTLRFLDDIVQMRGRQPPSLGPHINHYYTFPPEGTIAANYGKNTRVNLTRMRNNLEREGRLDFHKVEGVDDAERAMQLYLSQHEERWEPGESQFRSQNNCRMLLELGKLAVRTGKGEINELLIDGEVASQVLDLFDGNVSRCIRVGMTNKFRSFSPGLMILMMTMEENRKRGLEVFDLGYGNEDYKMRMTDSHRELSSAVVYRNSIKMISRVRSFPTIRVLENRLKK